MTAKIEGRYNMLEALARLVPNRLMRFAFLDQVVASGGNFLAAVLFARALGIYEFGRFALAWMIVEFMSSLQFAAIIQPMLNIGPKQAEADADRYYQSVIAHQGAACALLGPVVGLSTILIGSLMSDRALVGMALPLCAVIMTYQLSEFFRRCFFARGRPASGLCIDLLRFAIQLGAILALPHVWPDATAEVGIWIVTAACTVAAAQGALLFGRIEWKTTSFRSIAARHWQFSKWLLPSALMFWTTTQTYIVVSGLVLGAAATGALKAATTITGILNLLLLALNNFAPVQASHALHVGGAIELRRYIGRLMGLSVGLMGAVVAVLGLAPEHVVHLFYGEQYEGLGQLVRLLCAPAVIYGINTILVIWAAALEQTRLIFLSYAAATPFSIIAAFFLVQLAGIPGLVLCLFLVESIRLAVLLVPLVRWSRTRSYENAQLGPMRGKSRI